MKCRLCTGTLDKYFHCIHCGYYDPKAEVIALREKIDELEDTITMLKDTSNPELDNTPFESTAFSRGRDYGVYAVVDFINRVLNGEDTGTGIANEPLLEELRRKLLTIVQENKHGY